MKPIIICAALALVTVSFNDSQAATLWTSSAGTDGASCGSSESPCRSIS
jgi:hypothetical protein